MAVVYNFSGSSSNYLWQGVEPQGYDVPGISGVQKHVLIGPDDGTPNFVLRYFRVNPGGHSRLESHPQEHGIVILHGKAKVTLNDKIYSLEPLDVVFIPGGDKHQLKNVGDEELGFICVIPS
jgi:quercetin dioxygenase-like cupin family protein